MVSITGKCVMGVVSELALGFCCRILLLGSDTHLEPPIWTELSHLMNNILGEERMVENVRSCESLLWVHHQHPRDLQKQTNKMDLSICPKSSCGLTFQRWPTKSLTVSERSSHSGDDMS